MMETNPFGLFYRSFIWLRRWFGHSVDQKE